jgi:hypothetical protein
MDRPARLYLCVHCKAQVVLCSRCDRGNRYCGRTCSRQARAQAQRQAAQRYQGSWRGRMAHALRARRWRRASVAAGAGEAAHCVTHQGSQPAVLTAPLAACTPLHLCTELPACAAANPAPSSAAAACWYCRRCGARQGVHLRLGFVRHGLPARRRHDPGP